MCAFPASSWPSPKPKKEASGRKSATRGGDGEPQQRAPVDLGRLEVAEGGEVDGQRGNLEDWDAEERRRRHQHVQRVLPATRIVYSLSPRSRRPRHHAALELVPLPSDGSRGNGPGAERDARSAWKRALAVGAGGAKESAVRGRRGRSGGEEEPRLTMPCGASAAMRAETPTGHSRFITATFSADAPESSRAIAMKPLSCCTTRNGAARRGTGPAPRTAPTPWPEREPALQPLTLVERLTTAGAHAS